MTVILVLFSVNCRRQWSASSFSATQCKNAPVTLVDRDEDGRPIKCPATATALTVDHVNVMTVSYFVSKLPCLFYIQPGPRLRDPADELESSPADVSAGSCEC